jgi:4-hydroxy-3-methylbut-2-en-1-yl diphosphate synthase IspG/GcpE
MKINFKTKEAYCTFSEYNRLKEVLESTNVNINDFTIHVEEVVNITSKEKDKTFNLKDINDSIESIKKWNDEMIRKLNPKSYISSLEEIKEDSPFYKYKDI